MVLKIDGRLYSVLNVAHHTPGNKRSVIQIKMRDLESGSQREERYSSADRLEHAITEEVDMEYLYRDGDTYVFMNQENYEQLPLHAEVLGDDALWLKENTPCKVNMHEGNVIGVQVPFTVALEVVDTEPGLKGATITNVFKPAKLETGAMVQVPPFIEKGEIIKVDTRTGKYIERGGK
jgi:elongation factor P